MILEILQNLNHKFQSYQETFYPYLSQNYLITNFGVIIVSGLKVFRLDKQPKSDPFNYLTQIQNY